MKIIKFLKKKYKTILFVTGFVSLSVFFMWLPMETIVDKIGSDNAYLIMFVVAMVGGMTTFSGVPYQFLLFGFAHAGVDPILLGTVTALGVMAGDSTSYLLGRQSSELFTGRVKVALGYVSGYLSDRPRLVFPLLFVYGSVSPLSNDFIVISMGIARYSYWRVIVPLLFGNVVYHIGLAYLGIYAYDTIAAWF